MQNKFRCIDFDNSEQHRNLWNMLVDASIFGWCWHSLAWKDFLFATHSKNSYIEKSFFVFEDEKPKALVPLIVCEVKYDDAILKEGSYFGDPIPWPCVVDISDSDLINYIFLQLSNRIRELNADKISISCSSPLVTERGEWFLGPVNKNQFIDSSHDSYLVQVDDGVEQKIRKTYKKSVKKNLQLFEVLVIDKDHISDEIINAHYENHIKDAGGVFRDKSSYYRQKDLIVNGEAFMVVAKVKASKKIVGSLLISVCKLGAYDNSVAIDPEYEKFDISGLLKWETIMHLKKINIKHYELGRSFEFTTIQVLPTKKQMGIGFFKKGWSRNNFKKIYVAEKYYNLNALNIAVKTYQNKLTQYFLLK